MTPKLSICVPTYNRVKDIQDLSVFLNRALETYPGFVEVIVCDNSSAEIAQINKVSLGPKIQHFINGKNIGFHGNLIRCARESVGEFVWIISDNDPVIWEGFEEIVRFLKSEESKTIDCLMVPFSGADIYGNDLFNNRASDWGLERISTISQLIQTGNMPFILFSTGVIRADRSQVESVLQEFDGNDYIQTALFLNMLKRESKIQFSEVPTLQYTPGYIGHSLGVVSMADSMLGIRRFIEKKYGIRANYSQDYQGWLLWLVHHRGGLYHIAFGDTERWPMLRRLPQNPSLKAVVMGVALVLPKAVVQPAYALYRARGDVKRFGEKMTPGNLLKRAREYRRFIRQVHG